MLGRRTCVGNPCSAGVFGTDKVERSWIGDIVWIPAPLGLNFCSLGYPSMKLGLSFRVVIYFQ